MNSTAKARSLRQGILLIVVCCIGVLGFVAHLWEGDIPLATMFGVVTLLGFALGIWLIRRSLGGEMSRNGANIEPHRIDA